MNSGLEQCQRRMFLLASLAGGTALIGQSVSAASRSGLFDRAAYDRYVAQMNARDLRFLDCYADDIQFAMGLVGRAQVREFYLSQWEFVTETLEVAFFCSDAGGAAAEVHSELRCVRDFDGAAIFGRALIAGEVQRVRGYLFYTLDEQGLITRIKGPPPEVLQPWQMEPVPAG